MKKLTALLLLVFFMIGFTTIDTVHSQAVEHCPDGWSLKWETPHEGIVGPTLTLTEESTFCVKAGLNNSGIIIDTGFTVTWLNEGGQVPDISYVVFYETPTEEPNTPWPPDNPVLTFIPPTQGPPPTLPPPCEDCGEEVKMIPVTGASGEDEYLFLIPAVIVAGLLIGMFAILSYPINGGPKDGTRP